MPPTLELPPQVDPLFTLDWRYAIRACELPILKPVTIALAIFPAVFTDFTSDLPSVVSWAIWIASVSYLVAFLITYFGAPRLIREYPYFKVFKDEEHSHRWIIWIFFLSRQWLKEDWYRLVEETIVKELALPNGLADGRLRYCPFPPELQGNQEIAVSEAPINHGRDLSLAINRQNQYFTLTIYEDSDDLDKLVKELFWILYTHLAKIRPKLRYTAWGCLAISVGTILVAIGFGLFELLPLDEEPAYRRIPGLLW